MQASSRNIFNWVLTICFAVVMIGLLTLLFYPTARTFELRTVDDWRVIESQQDIRLSPMFGVKDERLYTIQLVSSAKQELEEYAASHPDKGNLSLVSPFTLNAYGVRSDYTSFSLSYWILVCLLPGIVLGIMMGRKKLKWRDEV